MLFHLPPTLLELGPAVVQEAPSQKRQYGELEIEFQQEHYDTETGLLTFTGFVTAKYDLTIITANELSLDLTNRRGVAKGGVQLRDPEALLTTERLEFDWGAKTGHAEQVYVQAGNMRIRAATLDIDAEAWRMSDAHATLSRRRRPNYQIIAKRVRIYPGKYGIANGVSVNLFGMSLGQLAESRFDLDPRIDGFNLPAFAERKGVGFGVSWNSSFLLNENAVIGGSWGSFPHRYPGYGLSLIWMNADPDKTFSKLKPQDDLKEQNGDGWFDNIAVKSTRQEAHTVGSPRLLYMAGSKWNTSTFARQEIANDVSKAYEFVVESAGTFNGFGLRANVRAQSIRHDADSAFVNRVATQFALISPVWYLTQNFGLQARSDVFATYSENTEFGWVRGLASLLYSPTEGVALGIAYSDTKSLGTPDFLFDRRLYDRALHGRLDYSRGPYTFRYLAKMDPGTGKLFDTEYEVALVCEGFEPFIVFRQFPSDYRIGVRFRIDDFVGRLQRRRVQRDVQRPF